MSGVEVFYQLHCLSNANENQDLARKYTYREYYDLSENRPEEFTDSEPTLRKHVDHCIDMLRQYLMCVGDVGIVTMNWVEKFGIYPDFSTQHKCRKFNKIVEWADEHAAPSLPYNGGIRPRVLTRSFCQHHLLDCFGVIMSICLRLRRPQLL
ncbi:hypothetical protein N7449_004564 [Penicillium cf. viridicatum]|uniref:Uncharacterized protein n=1 Tax=Penicillium cf. viridicatum TaxID=2972119 RepID=A0A9W9MJG8_9EURO|nr:hypothetical protein N7449_004564 [Penicillium cf. viridicatum]